MKKTRKLKCVIKKTAWYKMTEKNVKLNKTSKNENTKESTVGEVWQEK